MPGVRGLGLWDADEGIGATFSDMKIWLRSVVFAIARIPMNQAVR